MSKKIKVAFFFPKITPTAGGGFTFIDSVFYEIVNSKVDFFDFYIISNEDIECPSYVNFFNISNIVMEESEKDEYKNDLRDLNDSKNKTKTNIIKKIIKRINYKFYTFFSRIFEGIFKDLKNKIESINSRLKRIENIVYFNNDYSNKLNYFLEKNKIDLIWFINPAYISVNIPFVTTVWDLAHRMFPFFPEVNYTGWKWEDRENFYRSVLPKAAFIITGTEEGKKQIKNFYNISEQRIKVIPFTVPNNFQNINIQNGNFINSLNLKNKFLFYPAQFWPHKNHIVILKAVDILRNKYNINFDVVFTGSDKGNLTYIKNVVKEMELENNVYFPGFLPIESIITLYKNAFALVFPTLFGPDNIPPLEAFSLGCPVIASKIEGVTDQLEDAALFFDPTDELELSEKIYELANNNKLRDELIKKGYSIASKRNSKSYFEKIVDTIKEFEKYRRCWSSEEKYIHL